MPVPCDCCPTSGSACAVATVPFTGVAETAPQAGWNQTNLDLTIDNVTTSTTISGYTTTVGNTPSTTLEVTYTLTAPRGRVRGLRLWNQAGGNLNDADGLGNFNAEFYAGATLLTTLACAGANGAGPQTFLLPFGTELAGVDRVVLRNLSKLIGGSVAPLWRELQLVAFQTVFPCRRRSGVLEWYDEAGNQVANGEVVSCETADPFILPDLRMSGFFFGDDPTGTAENICAVSPIPSATTGWNAPVGGCYDPLPGNPTMTWGPTSSVVKEFANGPGNQISGAVVIQYSSLSLGPITWPTNNTMMEPGDIRISNPFAGGRRAVLTYLSGPAGSSASGTIRMEGGSNIGIHRTNLAAVPPIRWRLDFVSA
ncbi:hypothetical protein ACFWVB_20115 [Streptomyces microflavus]|uniref:hypothetical protein n=1 Tax=Streptomyces microflavus TaxID=1919 RepID=UPI00364DEB2A